VPFRFRLQRLLDRAIAREAAARVGLIRAQRAHAAHKDRVASLLAAPASVLRAIDADEGERSRRLQLSAARLRNAQAEYQTAHRDRDALDRLRDRRRVEYDAQLERAEQSELDDLNRATSLNRQVSR